MTHKLTIHQKPTYLHAVVTGRNSRENVEQYLAELLRECTARKCFRVLIEERLEGPRLQTVDVFEIVTQGSRNARQMMRAIAYVDVNADRELMHFAETVAVNRSLPVAVFSTVADAERWLLDRDRLATGPHAPGDAHAVASPSETRPRPGLAHIERVPWSGFRRRLPLRLP